MNEATRHRTLKKNQTDADKLIWRRLRNRQLSGYKFRRQHPIGPYIVDFFCPEKGVVIEIDGGQHSRQVEYDNLRSEYLESKGYRVLRFWNSHISKKINAVLEVLLSCLEDNPHHPDPLPQMGEREEDYDGLSSQERAETTVSRSTAAEENQSGFTLIELTVALLLAGIMMVGALFVYRNFMDTWDEELSRTEMQRQGTYALAVMEAAIKQAVYDDDDGGTTIFTIGNYGSGTDNKLTVTVPTAGGTRDVEYYHDDGASPMELKEKDAVVKTIIPDTHVEKIEVASLTFTDDTVVGTSGYSIRIDLKLSDTYGQTSDFTTSVRLRNEDVE